jgi:eukaryotic-like serine/threonine-protein kinase
MRSRLIALLSASLLALAASSALAAARKTVPAPGCHDEDGDGYGLGCTAGPDCNDHDATIHPGAVELCNYRDDDCNGLVDDSPACKAPPVDRSRVSVPAGRFEMGSEPGEGHADEQPRHKVKLPAYRLDRNEVTNREYEACVKAGRCAPPALLSSHRRPEYFGDPRFADYPVIFVDWNQAAAFCKFAGGRLPTEAEWEMAARGQGPASQRTYPWGNERPDCARANMGGDGSCVGDTDRVGRRELGKSPFGANDMAGNVWEWTSDWYDKSYYSKSPSTNPTGPQTGRLKVMRGGCWVSGADSLRVSCRKAELPSSWAYNVGFRCVYPK